MIAGDGQLVRAVDRLVNHVGHWTQARWTAPAGRGGRTHADVDEEVTRWGDPVPPMFWLRDPGGNSLIIVQPSA